jgi:hypothetical protein
MILPPSGVFVWLAAGATDMRRVRIPKHPAHPYRFEAAHRSEVMAPTVPI